MRRLWIAGLLFVGLVGCGDDGDSSGDALTKSEAIAEGDRICTDFRRTTDKLESDIDKLSNPTVKDAAPFFRRGTDAANAAMAKFRKLDAPDEDKAVLEDYLGGQAEELEALEGVTAAAEDGDRAEVQKLIDDADGLTEKNTRLAKQYGFKVCGSEGD